MKFINAAFVSALAVIATGALASQGEAAPLPTNVAAMKGLLNEAVEQVRYGGWHGGWGYRGWGHRGWGLGGLAAGAVIGGAIASSAYYGGYPYYGGGYYGAGYAQDCHPYGFGGYYPGYHADPYYGW